MRPAAISLARALRPDVVLMEAEMPGASGIEATEKLRGAAPQSAVVIFTLRDDAATQERARAASGAAFVAKHHKEGIPLAAMKEWQRRTRSGEGTSTLRRAERRSTQLPCVTVEVREGAAVRRVRHGEVPSDGGGSPPPGPPFGRCLLVWPGCMFLARANTVDLILKSRR